ncbi:MAG: peptidylprolyl isomerase [Methanocalculus sp. MSAO_Arc1]|uniref:FKBP-type peptidyl-prolyl cis-trans isomerase n=1 Tax=Methanocalculus TaxID=71151 RepID=UPI000FEFCCF0|nr:MULTISPECIES: FKBP-type peptidyl-prolyl cis-trans isomerase [unclassified Methanocalculus]MCP1661432.1 FKBP-type peptidyl-prolyl cis-trans isomerase 2 [Methanocalculus sp. AMF5]RQD80399.1 MAG: peptidylprolyl isomerase [Methanocalculus sp. MSAO_Arc1]
MRTPHAGDTVSVHFTARLADGTVIEASEPEAPVEAVLGAGTINPAFDEALREMSEGEKREIILPPDQAYGKYNKRLVFRLKRKKLNLKGDPVEGSLVKMKLPDGKERYVTILALDEKKVTIDANHPHAGETIHYTLVLEQIMPGPASRETTDA